MKSLQNYALILGIVFLYGCVTTRAQLNEQQKEQSGIVASDQPVVSDSTPVQNPDTTVSTSSGSQYEMEELKSALAKLNGKIEEMEQEKKTHLQSQAEEQQKLYSKIAELEKKLKEKEEADQGPVVPEGKSPLQAAKEAMASLKFEDAVHYLDTFLQENSKGKDVEEGTYLRGESYFKLKQFKKAIVDFSKIPEKFSKSNLHSKSLLKIAESFEALDMKEEAKAFYQDLFDKFPKTLEGKIAKKKLAGKSEKK